MKKYLLVAIVVLLVAAIVWCFIMDPVSVRKEDVASIEVYHYTAFRDPFGEPTSSEYTITVTDRNHIHYITDYLNNLLPIPGRAEEVSTSGFYRTLTLRDHQGNIITQVTLSGHNHIITDKGTFSADVGELNNNLYNIKEGNAIKTSLANFALIVIGWLIVIVFTSLAGLILFLIQMGICAKTDSIALRLLPTLVLAILCLFNFRLHFLTGVFYIASLMVFSDPWIGVVLIGTVTVLCIILGWRQGSGMRKENCQ